MLTSSLWVTQIVTVHMHHAVPFIVTQFMFLVRMQIPKFRIAKEKEKQDNTIKWPG